MSGHLRRKLRSAYRRLVQLYHPDHNAGSSERARRFEEVQRRMGVTTDYSFSKIRADARAEVSDLSSKARELPRVTRVNDLIDELASKLGGEPPSESRG